MNFQISDFLTIRLETKAMQDLKVMSVTHRNSKSYNNQDKFLFLPSICIYMYINI